MLFKFQSFFFNFAIISVVFLQNTNLHMDVCMNVYILCIHFIRLNSSCLILSDVALKYASLIFLKQQALRLFVNNNRYANSLLPLKI